jgi:zinc transporter 2
MDKMDSLPLLPDSIKARNRILVASGLCVLFMAGEIAGGIISGSLAILTDAAHMLSDLAGFMISLAAIYLANRPSSNKFSFGWHRAEILGAVISVLLIWMLTGVLCYEAVLRIIHRQSVDGKVMFATAASGVVFNIIMALVLYQTGHGHTHGLAGGGDHGHSHGGGGGDGGHGHSHGGGQHGHSHGAHHGHSHKGYSGVNDADETHSEDDSASLETDNGQQRSKADSRNVNVRAAYIHVLGDLVQSIGVCIAAVVVWVKPEWTLADPICTFFFSILVLFTTFGVIRDSVNVLMEGTPKGLDVDEVRETLEALSGVHSAHQLHIWSLTVGKTALAVHLSSDGTHTHDQLLKAAQDILCSMYSIHHTTIQVELNSSVPGAQLTHCNQDDDNCYRRIAENGCVCEPTSSARRRSSRQTLVTLPELPPASSTDNNKVTHSFELFTNLTC